MQSPGDDHWRKLRQERSTDDTEPLNAVETEILNLVAASTPSHRGAWRKGSKAWQLFARSQDGKPADSIIPEETEDGDEVSRNGLTQDGDEISDVGGGNSK